MVNARCPFCLKLCEKNVATVADRAVDLMGCILADDPSERVSACP